MLKLWIKYTEVDTYLFAQVDLINFVADVQWLPGEFISYLKGDGKPFFTVELRILTVEICLLHGIGLVTSKFN